MIGRQPTFQLSEVEADSLSAKPVDQVCAIGRNRPALPGEIESFDAISVGSLASCFQFLQLAMPTDALRSNGAGEVDGFGPGASGLREDLAAFENSEVLRNFLESAEGFGLPKLMNRLLERRLSGLRMTIDVAQVAVEVSWRSFKGTNLPVEVRKAPSIRQLLAVSRNALESSRELVPVLELVQYRLKLIEARGSQLRGTWVH